MADLLRQRAPAAADAAPLPSLGAKASSVRSSADCATFFPRPYIVLNIVANEAMERFAFYGIRAMLVIYLTTALHYSSSVSVALYSIFNAVCYLTPLIGSYLADAVVGKVTTVILFNAIYLCGLLTLALNAFTSNVPGILAGLFILAIGTGGIKPNIAPLGAEQVEHGLVQHGKQAGLHDEEHHTTAEESHDRRRAFFSFFYWAINGGACVSMIAIPLVRVHAGFGWAFMTCFFALLASVVIFMLPIWLYSGYYDTPPSSNSAWVRVGDVFGKCCYQRCCRQRSRIVASTAATGVTGAVEAAAAAAASTAGEMEPSRSGEEADALLPGAASAAYTDSLPIPVAGAGGAASSGTAESGSASTVAAAGSRGPFTVPLFAADDEQAAVCTCVNAAVEYELEEMLIGADAAEPAPRIVLLTAPTPDGAASAAAATAAAAAAPSCCGRGVGDPVPVAAAVPFDLLASPALGAELARLQRTQAHTRDVRGVLRLLPLFAVLPIFWLIFDSQGSVWMVQRMAMNYCWGALCATPEQLGVLNPVFILILIPAFDRGIIPALERCGTRADGSRNWLYPTPLRRMAVGMQVATLSFVCSAAVQAAMDAAPGPGSVSMFAQVPQFLLITVAEILVSITGLEFAYSQAPHDMKSTILAIYYISISVGDLLTALLYTALASVTSQLNIMLLFAAMILVAGVAFSVLAGWYKPSDEGGGGDAAGAAHAGPPPPPPPAVPPAAEPPQEEAAIAAEQLAAEAEAVAEG